MYQEFFGLSQLPFNAKLKSDFFFASAAHLQAMAHLRAGLQHTDGTILLTGDKGVGKTAVTSFVLDQLDSKQYHIAFIQRPPGLVRDFLPAILGALKIPVTDPEPKQLFHTLHHHALLMQQSGKQLLIVVDGAQTLTESCLEFLHILSTWQDNGARLVQLILSGRPEIEEKLNREKHRPFKDQIEVSYKLQAMQSADTREYILHRLNAAGWQKKPQFSEDGFLKLHELSGGVAENINKLVHNLLGLAMLSKSAVIDARLIDSMTPQVMDKLAKMQEQQGWQASVQATQPAVDRLFDSETSTGGHQQTVSMDSFITAGSKISKKSSLSAAISLAVVSGLAVFLYNNMLAHNPEVTLAQADTGHAVTHEPARGASSHESSHSGGKATQRYVLEELSGAGNAQLLNIHQLVDKSAPVQQQSSPPVSHTPAARDDHTHSDGSQFASSDIH